MTDSSRSLMERYFRAWDEHDLESLRGMLAPGFTVHACHPEDVAGDHAGFDAFIAWHDRKRSLAGAEYGFRLDDLLVGERHALALFRLTSARDGSVYEWHQSAFYHVGSERIREAWVHQEPVREVEGRAALDEPAGWIRPPFR